jgi:hypothetical protein
MFGILALARGRVIDVSQDLVMPAVPTIRFEGNLSLKTRFRGTK